AFALRVRGLSKDDRYRRADEMMEKVRISELAARLPAQLSGGQQQRVALARAAITEPKVLLLDEPLSALDEQLRIRMRAELRAMQRDLGITFIHVTHTQLEAIALADLVVVMEKGKIKQAGPPREIYDKPHDRYVAEFLGGQNVLSGRIDQLEANSLVISGPEIKKMRMVRPERQGMTIGDNVDIAVRRDQIRLLRPDRQSDEDLITVASRVQAIEYQGSFVKVMLDTAVEDEFLAFVPESTFFDDPFEVGDVVLASWQATQSQLLARSGHH
ncbi:MAG: ABC transporter ATP-binding protein, partial [Pseudomonadota bacterium]